MSEEELTDNEYRVMNNMAKVLRHEPEIINVELDERGWCDLEKMIYGIDTEHNIEIDREIVKRVVKKTRNSFEMEDGKIRATHRHSVDVNPVVGAAAYIPQVLFTIRSKGELGDLLSEKGLESPTTLYETEKEAIKEEKYDNSVIIVVDAIKEMKDNSLIKKNPDGSYVALDDLKPQNIQAKEIA